MTQAERRQYLIQYLLQEDPRYSGFAVPESAEAQELLLRGLMNVRPPKPAEEAFLKVQDAYLQAVTADKGITDYQDLTPVEKSIYLWRGDITTLRCDAIVNAANSGMTGCYRPNHHCIDNCIHTFAGVQLRLACAQLMEEQGHEEPTGRAKITPAYNLPCRYVLHTVGPIIDHEVGAEDRRLLASCYRSCLELAEEYWLKSVAFCCISTGVFRFPGREAARIAVETVREFQKNSDMEVIFNVFQEEDLRIYRELLG